MPVLKTLVSIEPGITVYIGVTFVALMLMIQRELSDVLKQ